MAALQKYTIHHFAKNNRLLYQIIVLLSVLIIMKVHAEFKINRALGCARCDQNTMSNIQYSGAIRSNQQQFPV